MAFDLWNGNPLHMQGGVISACRSGDLPAHKNARLIDCNVERTLEGHFSYDMIAGTSAIYIHTAAWIKALRPASESIGVSYFYYLLGFWCIGSP